MQGFRDMIFEKKYLSKKQFERDEYLILNPKIYKVTTLLFLEILVSFRKRQLFFQFMAIFEKNINISKKK